MRLVFISQKRLATSMAVVTAATAFELLRISIDILLCIFKLTVVG
jgi:hypothetical protein